MFTFHHEQPSDWYDPDGPPIFRITAQHGQTWLGDLHYRRDREASFLLGVSVAPAWQRQGVASALLDEWCRRAAGARLVVNSTRENTVEGNALLRAWERSRRLRLRRVDTGLDGD